MAASLKCALFTGVPSRSSRLLHLSLGQNARSLTVKPYAYPQRPSIPCRVPQDRRHITSEARARSLHEKANADELSEPDAEVEHHKKRQQERPWHREGVDQPPVRRQRSAGAMTKGKLLTTPSRLLKLVLPLSTVDHNTDRKDVAPLALLVHPQQPLSYLERLIQAELPPPDPQDSKSTTRSVTFRAMEAKDDEIKPRKKADTEGGGGSDGSVQSYSGAGREGEGKDEGEFVRWSPSTEIGDFIRDAARAKEFEVEIEGSPGVIKVAVPSFNDRTYYLRQRLRRTSRKISKLAAIKEECDKAAHRGAQRIALAGCGGLIGYWYIVYRLTFETDLGWDVMEPVTYLVGLSTLIGGYMWFLWHNREVSYRSALNITVSARQNKLYQAKGFSLQDWEGYLEEANAMRREIKAVASEYDVDWNETQDEGGDEKVTKALRDERKNNNGTKNKSKEGEEDDEDD